MRVGFLPFLVVFLACESQKVQIAPPLPESILERVRFFPEPVSSQINSSWDQSPLCQQDKFCWQNPLLTGLPLNGFWGNRPNSIWAVGEQGSILFFDGTKWSAQISPTNDSLQVVWGMDETHVWAMGEKGTFLFFDGSKWSLLSSMNFPKPADSTGYTRAAKSMTGTGPNNIWIIIDDWEIQLAHYDGNHWIFFKRGGIIPNHFPWAESIWSDGTNIWLATGQSSGEAANILRWDGTTWTESLSQTQPGGSFLHIAGTDGNHIWTVGHDGAQDNVIYTFDGTSWKSFSTPTERLPDTRLQQILPFSDKDIWVVERPFFLDAHASQLWHFDGTNWAKQEKSIEVTSIYGFNSTDLWLLSPQTTLLQSQLWRFDGHDIKSLTQNIFENGTAEKTTNYGPSISAFWSADGTEIWALSHSIEINRPITKILQGDGKNWRVAYQSFDNLSTIWGSSKNDIWFGGEAYLLLHYDGKNWTDGIVQGAGYFRDEEHRNGYSIDHRILSLWGTSQSNIWAVGEDGLILHYDGKIWTKIPSGINEFLLKIWGFDENNIWAVGYNNTLLHYDGMTWQSEIGMIPLHFDLYGLWGVKEKQVTNQGWQCLYLVGSEILGNSSYNYEERGLLLQGCKSKDQAQFSWSRINYEGKNPTLAQNDTLTDIWLDSTSNIWSVGYKGEILHFDGKTWNIESPAGQLPALFSVWGLSNQQLWFGGKQGTILRLKNE